MLNIMTHGNTYQREGELVLKRFWTPNEKFSQLLSLIQLIQEIFCVLQIFLDSLNSIKHLPKYEQQLFKAQRIRILCKKQYKRLKVREKYAHNNLYWFDF